jgi:hypothetical protein
MWERMLRSQKDGEVQPKHFLAGPGASRGGHGLGVPWRLQTNAATFVRGPGRQASEIANAGFGNIRVCRPLKVTFRQKEDAPNAGRRKYWSGSKESAWPQRSGTGRAFVPAHARAGRRDGEQNRRTSLFPTNSLKIFFVIRVNSFLHLTNSKQRVYMS